MSLEVEHLFRPAWYLAGPLAQLADPGDYLTCEAVQVPIVVTRDLDGELRGFVNVCRHRFHKVALGKGNRNALTCGYHGWTYELDGRLRSAPGSERERRFNKCDIALRPVAVDTWKGFVFVNPDPDAQPFLETYPALDAIAKKWRFDLTGYKYWGEFPSEMNVNWKLTYENGAECYHCPTVHPDLANLQEPNLEYTDYFTDGKLMASLCPFSKVNKDKRPFSDREFGYRNFYLWPVIFISQDEYIGFTGQFMPTGPEGCRFTLHGYHHPDLDKDFLEELTKSWSRIAFEDEEVFTRIKQGIRAGVETGYLLPKMEPLCIHHQQLYWQNMERHLRGLGEIKP